MGGDTRRMPIGAEVHAPRGVEFRVWAPTHPAVTLVLEAPEHREIAMTRDADGYHAAVAAEIGAGARYRFRIGDDPALLADPASRFQPAGPFGSSQVIDPSAYAWRDAAWRGLAPHRHVLYELHVGTFTPEGTYAAAARWLPYLAEVGITTLELMPLAAFPGARNWGYDGVNLFAPSHTYGTPDDLRRFVDAAHAAGIAVILDVVYNHFGPSGNVMFAWCPYYRSARATEWGEAINFDGEGSAGVRAYVLANARYWIDEFHLDGYRIDATQCIEDASPTHILTELVQAARAAGGDRRIFMLGENEPQDTALLRGAAAFDALWNDDFHHTARVALTGVVDGYLHDYGGTPQELVSALERGFLYQGQIYPWQRNPRGTSTRGVPRHRFVHYLENHDQVANLGFGERLAAVTVPALLRALTAVLLLGPELPMLFQGQEAGARQPWRFFVDHGDELRDAVRQGRAAFVAQFSYLATPEARAALPDPCDEATFRACILDPAERTFANPSVRLHRDLLRLRSSEPVFAGPVDVEGAVLDRDVFAIRYATDVPRDDRLLLVNLGATFTRGPVPEPRVAPPAGTGWRVAWSSEDPAYGGHGTPPIFTRARVAIPARTAVFLVPDPAARIVRDPRLFDRGPPTESDA